MNQRLALFSFSLAFALTLALPALAADQYSWSAQYSRASTQPGSPPTAIILSGGPFSTQAACYADVSNRVDAYQQQDSTTLTGPTQNFCVCDSPIAQQGSQCPGYTAPTAAPATNNTLTQQNNTGGALNQQNNSGGALIQQGSTGGTGQSVTLINPLGAGTSLETFISDILKFVVRIGSVIVILMLVYIGFLFVTAQGKEEKIREARQALMWTVVGALILLGAQAIASGIQATASALSTGS